MITLYPVRVLDDHIAYVAFDYPAARAFAHKANEEAQCDITEVEELALVDNYGFCCERREAAFIAPWIAEASDSCMKWYSPDHWAAYVRMMSQGG